MIFGAVGCVWITTKKTYVDYSEYLGPDWKPDYDSKRTSTVISNHSCFLDAMVHGLSQLPSHIAKGEVRKFPGIGIIAEYCQCLFIDRSSKDDKVKI